MRRMRGVHRAAVIGEKRTTIDAWSCATRFIRAACSAQRAWRSSSLKGLEVLHGIGDVVG